MTAEDVLARIAAEGSEHNRQGMARFGINVERAAGVSVAWLRALGREIGRDHDLALALWASRQHEARILASIVADPARLDRELAEAWVAEFDSWDLCDQTCQNLFWRLPDAVVVAVEWTGREAEFVKRAGFALGAVLCRRLKGADDDLRPLLGAVSCEAHDPRNYVNKAVNWCLRELGKHSVGLHAAACAAAERLVAGSKGAARWVGRDALRELRSERVAAKLGLDQQGCDDAGRTSSQE